MVRRKAPVALALVLVLAALTAEAVRRPFLRRAPPAAGSRGEGAAAVAAEREGPLAVEGWSGRFQALQAQGDWAQLARELEAIRAEAPALYDRYRLGYLAARARIETGEIEAAAELLKPFLAENDPFRDLALHHAARLAAARGRGDEAAQARTDLIDRYPKALYRTEALEGLGSWLEDKKDAAGLELLLSKAAGQDEALRRDLEARLVVVQLAAADPAAARERGLKLVKARPGDDASGRVILAFDQAGVVDTLGPEEWALLGESHRSHRHYERARELLERARAALPGQRDELTFALGRAQFGAERFAEAEKIYLEGAAGTRSSEQKAAFYYHASRCAQLTGDDARAEKHLAAAITLRDASTPSASALTQRLRTRIHQKRFVDAAADLAAVRKRFARSHASVDAGLAYGVGQVAAGRGTAALVAFNAIPRRLLTEAEEVELHYWKGRASEARSPATALRHYLQVLATNSHFASFARLRLAEPALARAAGRAARAAEVRAQAALARGDVEAARQARTEAYLFTPLAEADVARERLREVYAKSPRYAAILELAPSPFPHFPLFPPAAPGASPPPPGPDVLAEGVPRVDLLLAMGLFDDAVDALPGRYPFDTLASGLTQAEALRRGGASQASIRGAEIVMRSVPPDYVFELLPRPLAELLYPRYFYAHIEEDAKSFGVDPHLVLAIMREESRFNPRARSLAAARGLLQLIISTAREVGQLLGLVEVKAEDLYEPRKVIKLGTRYLADLKERLGEDPYPVVAAYNAGPFQARLWSRLAAGPGHDFFVSAVNFDETKGYVSKVLRSHGRYRQLYGEPR